MSDTSTTSWNQRQLFSTTEKGSGAWATPDDLFERVNDEFVFMLDAAAQAHNAKVSSYITPEEDSLSVDWVDRAKGGPVWLNPPYGRGMTDWLRKAYQESLRGCTVVVLTFVRTDTAWWQDWATKAAEVRLIRGRIYFEDATGKTGPATAPSCLLIFSEDHREPKVTTVDLPRGNGK